MTEGRKKRPLGGQQWNKVPPLWKLLQCMQVKNTKLSKKATCWNIPGTQNSKKIQKFVCNGRNLSPLWSRMNAVIPLVNHTCTCNSICSIRPCKGKPNYSHYWCDVCPQDLILTSVGTLLLLMEAGQQNQRYLPWELASIRNLQQTYPEQDAFFTGRQGLEVSSPACQLAGKHRGSFFPGCSHGRRVRTNISQVCCVWKCHIWHTLLTFPSQTSALGEHSTQHLTWRQMHL